MFQIIWLYIRGKSPEKLGIVTTEDNIAKTDFSGPVVETPAGSTRFGVRQAPPQLVAFDGNADTGSFRQLADMVFLPSDVLQPHERALVLDMISVALPAAAPDERLRFANRISTIGSENAGLMRLFAALARDEDERVARVILESGANLDDDIIIELITAASDDRLPLIASRPGLSSAATAMLVDKQVITATAACLANPKAAFSHATLSRCIELASTHAELCNPLIARPELNPAVALDLFWLLNHRGRVQILRRFLADDQYIRRTAGAGDSVHDSTVFSGDPAERNQALERINAYFAVGDLDHAVPLLARAASIRDAAAHEILADAGGEALAVVYKAAGVNRAHFVDLCERARKTALSTLADDVDIEALGILFDQLSRGQAHMAVTYWDWRAAGIGPYAHRATARPQLHDLNDQAGSSALDQVELDHTAQPHDTPQVGLKDDVCEAGRARETSAHEEATEKPDHRGDEPPLDAGAILKFNRSLPPLRRARGYLSAID